MSFADAYKTPKKSPKKPAPKAGLKKPMKPAPKCPDCGKQPCVCDNDGD